jgi:hypothetical protein
MVIWQNAAQRSRRPGSLTSHKADWSHKAVARPTPAEEGVRWRAVGGVNTRRGWRVRRATSRRRELILVAGRLRGGGIGGGSNVLAAVLAPGGRRRP